MKYFAVIFDTVYKDESYLVTAKLYTDYWETECEKVTSERGWSVVEELGFKPVDRGNYRSWRNPNVTLANR